jgi:hypothetical protein
MTALVATLAATSAAAANSISYVCPNDEYKSTITVNLSNSTVSVDGSAELSAKITASSIDWQEKAGTTASTSHIDRTSGVLTEQATLRKANGSVRTYPSVKYRCTKSGASKGN